MKEKGIVILGGGCFWCIEAIFKRVRGVVQVLPGYAGGHTQNPNYQQVCSGLTGHAEVVRIEYDPVVITFPQLLEIFWQAHDPTTLNRQGNDIGTQYRSIIFYTNDEQRTQAEESIRKQNSTGLYQQQIVTEVQPLENFYPAEEYHHSYFEKNPSQPYCRAVISPKIQHFLKSNPEALD